MPKELARVVAKFKPIENQAPPLLVELRGHQREFREQREYVSIAMTEIAQLLKAAKIPGLDDPRARQNGRVLAWLDDLEKYEALMIDRRAQWSKTALKLDKIRGEVDALQKDVLAVLKAKSGFFSTSKSRPALMAFSTQLTGFSNSLQAVTSSP